MFSSRIPPRLTSREASGGVISFGAKEGFRRPDASAQGEQSFWPAAKDSVEETS